MKTFSTAAILLSVTSTLTQAKSFPFRGNAGERRQTKTYSLVDKYQGQNFFQTWNFFSSPDPTHGSVNYLNQGDATGSGLASVDPTTGVLTLAVDDTNTLPEGTNRNSIRIQSNKAYTGGLFIADFAAMPYGCSVWPAYWSVGPGWPQAGEIDVLEGTNNAATNQYTLHTGDWCSLDPTQQMLGKPAANTNCASINSNDGCAVLDTDARSYGAQFNAVGGGVFAHLWDSNGIRIWHFARSDIPQDISAGNPNPSGWGTPAAVIAPAKCDMTKFHDHNLIINIALCGDWAGATYQGAGCPGTCSQAVANPQNYANAKFKINYIAVYA